MQYEPSLIRLLRCFTNTDVRGFTDLAKELGMDADLCGYYLRKLQSRKLLTNVARGKYQITALGKSVLAHQKQFSGLEPVPRVSVLLIVATPQGYLVTQRRKQPFLNKLEWPVASLRLGEPLRDAAQRLARERLGVLEMPRYQGLCRCIDRYNDTIFDDRLFAVHAVHVETGAFTLSKNDVGDIVIMSLEGLRSNHRSSRSLVDILNYSDEHSPYKELLYTLQKSDIFDIPAG